MEPKIIYEDADILAVNKPAGLSMHPDNFSAGPTLLGWLEKKYPGVRLVHRLDKDTSGVIVAAKNEKAHEFLKQQFQNREVKKTYRLIVCGVVKNDEGVIDVPIGRSRRDPRQRLAGRGAVSTLREAITNYRVLERFSSYTYVEAKPTTGRTHQLRVHFKYLNYPVAGDALYAPKCLPPIGLARQALHAQSLEIKLPAGAALKLEAGLPVDFTQALETLRAAC